ncbi:MAG: hypothetical protein GXO21_04625, partial [Aquificae bacterium]|nr:hypothetical protein [Aquificota bacterium]
MKKLARSALFGALATGIIATAAKAHTPYAQFFIEFVGTQAADDPITVPCEAASKYLVGKDYDLSPNGESPLG